MRLEHSDFLRLTVTGRDRSPPTPPDKEPCGKDLLTRPVTKPPGKPHSREQGNPMLELRGTPQQRAGPDLCFPIPILLGDPIEARE